MTSLFSKQDLQNAIPEIGKYHPYLPDRKWLKNNIDLKLNDLLIQLNQGDWKFESFQAYFEWQGKHTPSIQMSTLDWLVHFVILEKLEQTFQNHFLQTTAYHLSKMDALLEQCKVWKKETKDAWILKTDIKSFFQNIQHPILLKNLAEKNLSKEWFPFLQSYLHAMKNAMLSLNEKSSELYKYQEEKGLTIGAELNYFLAGAYLLPIDEIIANSKYTINYARYMDDILVFTENEKSGLAIQETITITLQNIGLQLNDEKTVLQSTNLPLQFLRQEI